MHLPNKTTILYLIIILHAAFNLAYLIHILWNKTTKDAIQKDSAISEYLSQVYNESKLLIGEFEPRNPLTNEFLLSPRQFCLNNDTVFFLAVVITSPDSFLKRERIRSTWANRTTFSNNKLRVLFTFSSTSKSRVNARIRAEFQRHNDILQLNSHTTTGILMLTLKWITQHCANVKYILRVYDYILVNTRALLEKFPDNVVISENQVYGLIIREGRVNRNENSIFSLSKQHYKFDKYPNYPSGSALILTGDLASSFVDIYEKFYFRPFNRW